MSRRSLGYVATVQGNGNLLVGKAYTAMLDVKPGDEFEIKLGRKQIKLIPAGSEEEYAAGQGRWSGRRAAVAPPIHRASPLFGHPWLGAGVPANTQGLEEWRPSEARQQDENA